MTNGMKTCACGAANPPTAAFCNNCGAPVLVPQGGYVPPPPVAYKSQATIAIILAIVGLVVCGPLTTVPGIFFAKQDLNAVKEGRAPQSISGTANIALWLNVGVTVISVMICGLFGLLSVLPVAMM